jgi:hypothetical protein
MGERKIYENNPIYLELRAGYPETISNFPEYP